MKDPKLTKSLQFYLILFSTLLAVVFVLQILFYCSNNRLNHLFPFLSAIGFIIIILQFVFIFKRFERELQLLWQSIRNVIDHNFSRKYKLHIIRTDDEIGRISREVAKMLEKLHYRTTEVLLRRKELAHGQKNIEMLGAIGREITSKLSVEQIILASFERISQLLDASLLAIGIMREDHTGLDFYGIREANKNIIRGFDDMMDKNRWGVYCFNQQKEVFCNEYDQCSGHYFSSLLFNEPFEKRESFIYIPLTLRNERIGVFTVQSFQKNAYTVYHLNLLRNLANYIMVALTNASAFQKIELQKEELLKASLKLQEAQQFLEQQVADRTQKLRLQKEEIEQKNIELERLSLVARKTDNAIMIMDSLGNIQWINDCFHRIYNYSYDDFIRKRGNNILQTSFYPDIKKVLKKCLTTKKSVYYEAANITGDGREIWTQTTLTPVINNAGEITHLLTIDSDITRRKEYEQKIIQQTRDITQSILYAKQIQQAVLPPREWFAEALHRCFILYKPKDIVSGDFYWISQRKDKILIAVGDCTGHGVPGAFMSMLGISLLNEMAYSNDWKESGKFLDVLRTKIKNSLRQAHGHYDNADGMDLAFCMIDKKNKKLLFSGANNALHIIRKGEYSSIKGDKMPIGLYINDDVPFSVQTFEYLDGDRFYITTDGYLDQFGGEKDSKFMMNRFRNLLQEIQDIPIVDQSMILDKKIMEWQGNNIQIDDICVLGFEII